MDSLGTRIRALRKEQKLTLAELAGERLTKGMLSQIENDKAKPSMESLDYIAERLGVKASELLEQITPSTLRHLLEEVEILFTEVNRGDVENHLKIVEKIAPYVDEMPLSYEAGRLFYIYADAQYEAGLATWEAPLLQARAVFKEINLLSHWLMTYILQAVILAEKFQYQEAHHCFVQVEQEIEQENYRLDARYIAKLSYFMGVSLLAIGKHREGQQRIQEAIANAHRQQLYDHIDDLYRIGVYCAMIDGDFEQAEQMLTKLEQYRLFVEQVQVDAFTFMVRAHYYTNYVHDYQRGLEEVERFRPLMCDDSIRLDKNYYYAEKGKALYLLGRYAEAKETFQHFTTIPIFIQHPYDLLGLYECFAYKALCYTHFGELTTAYDLAKTAYQQSLIFTDIDLPYKQKIAEIYQTIKAHIDS
ncbi:helix-turn-helix domain-containing protein [Lysinibacillus piscis]|uniref:Transcriptional regulator n=1 Tax=Lysinibacillus piscis TaxID=2518931 RepID=A0ABQ5NMN1_9BACI|nr:helix-turn-helix domain-containing protein [Lysinibacillus sp. KH24]GLC89388.1 transcriptional regulator [Lysinibacillus sp. KH24]